MSRVEVITREELNHVVVVVVVLVVVVVVLP